VPVLVPEEHRKASDLADVGEAVHVEGVEAVGVQVAQQLEAPHRPDRIVEDANPGPALLEYTPEEGGALGGFHAEPVQIGEDVRSRREDAHPEEPLVGDEPHPAQQLLARRHRRPRVFERRYPLAPPKFVRRGLRLRVGSTVGLLRLLCLAEDRAPDRIGYDSVVRTTGCHE
jgi:hypothetical protein